MIPHSEPVFVNVSGAQESIAKNRFHQPDGPVRQIGLSYRAARMGIDFRTPSKGLQIRTQVILIWPDSRYEKYKKLTDIQQF